MSGEENVVADLPGAGKEGKRAVGVMFLLSQPFSNWTHCVYGNSHWGAGLLSWGGDRLLLWNELSAEGSG